MLKTIIKLPDGTEISSGANHRNAIQSVTLTECVNSGEDLILGSTCCNALEVTLITPEGGLSLQAGTEVTVYKEDGTARKDVGVFILEKPTRPTARTMKITGYDRVSKLDKDLSAWLSGLEEWPYPLTTFAGMVCEACGLEYKPSAVINGDFPVQQFTRSTVTGRQIMRWLGEICARFCQATPDGKIEFAWYADSGKAITAGGEIYCFQKGLSYEDYETAKVDAVQLRLANSNDGALWPEAAGAVNSYIITGNAILNLQITESLRPVLANIQAAVADVSYTPCKVSIPANMDIRAGNTVRITDKNGKNITAYVMTKTQTGQKDTLECTGSRMRNTTAAVNNKTSAEKAVEAVASQTWQELFNKWTNGGKIQGIFTDGNAWVINAELAQILNLIVKSAQIESLEAGKITGLIDSDRINGKTLVIEDGATISTWKIDENSIYENEGYWPQGTFMCTGSKGAYSIGGSPEIPNWVFGAGGKFGVTREGAVWLSDLHATNGEFTAAGDGYGVEIKGGLITVKDSNNIARVMITRFENNYGIHICDSGGSVVTGLSSAGDKGILIAKVAEGQGSGIVGLQPVWKTINGVTYLVAE